MLKINKLIIITSFLILHLLSFSQTRVCQSSIDLVSMQQNDPVRYQRWANLEQFTNNFINSGVYGRLVNQNGVIIIPVVIHVLHRNENIGNGKNISVEQIQSQIDVLNQDFRFLNTDRNYIPAPFVGVAADFSIEFRLACRAPNGNATDGIIRKYTSRQSFYFSMAGGLPNEDDIGIKYSIGGGDDAWPTDRYLNIWVSDLANVDGYSTFPGDYVARPNVDGIVIDYKAFGTTGKAKAPLNRGRTTTHEIGHWLNLRHIWGDTFCGDDLVGDTPPQSIWNDGCETFPKTSSCSISPDGDMFMNFMDYSDDRCMYLFTLGQRQRGRALFATGGPRASFIDNYFRIDQPTVALRCKEVVKLINPNCVPVIWTVISGPATIESSDNSQAVLKANLGANGNVQLRAIGGNYVSDITFGISYDPPLPSQITPTNFDASCGSFVEAYSTEPPGATGYIWNLNFGQTIQNLSGPYSNYFNSSPLVTNPQTGRRYFNYLTVQAQNSCGVSAPSSTVQLTVGPVPASCSSGGGCCMLRISPNPSNGFLFVETKDNSKFTQLKFVDRMGNVRKTLSVISSSSATINISDLPPDVYRVQALINNKWSTEAFIKQ